MRVTSSYGCGDIPECHWRGCTCTVGCRGGNCTADIHCNKVLHLFAGTENNLMVVYTGKFTKGCVRSVIRKLVEVDEAEGMFIIIVLVALWD